jgi:putative phosphoesterase
MRIAFISDIHGHFQALQAVLSDIARDHVQSVVCLGDVISLGPQPREVIELLQKTDCQLVMGNHDEPFVDPAKMAMVCYLAEEIYTLNRWTAEQVSDDELDFLRTFKPTIEIEDENGRQVLCFHGTPRCNHEGIFPETPEAEVDAALHGCPEIILVGGHTHRQMIRESSGRLILNPGSVGSVFDHQSAKGQKRSLRPWAEYGILDLSGAGPSFELKRVPFDIQAVQAAVAKSDMPYKEWWVGQYATERVFGRNLMR